MNKKNWNNIIEGKVVYENDANDYYFQWVEFEHKEYSMLGLFEKVFNIGCGKDVKVKVKFGKGILFFEEIKELEEGVSSE